MQQSEESRVCIKAKGFSTSFRLVCLAIVLSFLLIPLIGCSSTQSRQLPSTRYRRTPAPGTAGIRTSTDIISPFAEQPTNHERIAVMDGSASDPSARIRTERPLKEHLIRAGYHAISLVETLPVQLLVEDPRLYEILRNHEIDIMIITSTDFAGHTHVTTQFLILGVDLNQPDDQVLSTPQTLLGVFELRAPAQALVDIGGADAYIRHVFDQQARGIVSTYSSVFAE